MNISELDLFIERHLDGEVFREITQEKYDENLKEFKKDLEMAPLGTWFDNISIEKEAILLVNYDNNYEFGGCDWGFAFQFEHNGKYYLFEDYGGY